MFVYVLGVWGIVLLIGIVFSFDIFVWFCYKWWVYKDREWY